MRTLISSAEATWAKFGHRRADGRCFIDGEYVGRIVTTKDGDTITVGKGMRGLCWVGEKPAMLACHYLESAGGVR